MTYHKAPYKYPTQFCKEPHTGSKLSHAKGVTLWTILCLTTVTLDFEQTQSYYLCLNTEATSAGFFVLGFVEDMQSETILMVGPWLRDQYIFRH